MVNIITTTHAIARPGTVYDRLNTTPPLDGSTKWSRMWHWTNIATETHHGKLRYSPRQRRDALDRMRKYHDDDTRQHFFSALAQVLRNDPDPSTRRLAIGLLVTHFPEQCELVFWRMREFSRRVEGDMKAIESARRWLATKQRNAQQAAQQNVIQRAMLERLAHPVVIISPQVRFRDYGLEGTINWEDGKLRLYAAKRLPKQDFRKLMDLGFRYVRGDEVIFYASYTPAREDLLYDWFGIETLLDDDTSMRERAEERSERYEGYSENADKRAKDHRQTANDVLPSPVEQPILIGHHSEPRHRRALDRHDNHMRKYFDEADKAEYWSRRAKSALARVRKRETTAAISKRIARLEADERKFQRQLDDYPNSGFYQQWLWFVRNRLDYERALLEAMPADKQPLSAKDIEAGGAIRRGNTWYQITKVARVNLFYFSHSCRLKDRIDTITPRRYMPPDEFQQAIEAGKLKKYDEKNRYGDRDTAYVIVPEAEGVTS